MIRNEEIPVLLEIGDSSLGLRSKRAKKYSVRLSPRAVLIGKGGKIALINVSKRGYWKLPGGGLGDGESVFSALERELLEETGCRAKLGALVGAVIERRERFSLIQISHCYIARAVSFGKSRLEKGEKDDGFSLEWKSFSQAKRLLSESRPKNYEGHFIVRRDSAFLERAEKLVGKRAL